MGRSLDGSDAYDVGDEPYDCYENELPEHAVQVSDFYLDSFEVAVGRFRRFVELYPAEVPPLPWTSRLCRTLHCS